MTVRGQRPRHDSAPSTAFAVGLTGGIACGKTTVANRFAERGAAVIDADVIARDLVHPGSDALQAIIEQFGTDVLLGDGELNRRRLREIVFADPDARTALEDILHPRVRSEIVKQLGEVRAAYVVVVIPLLVETSMTDVVDRIAVIDCPEKLQITRVMARDNSTAEQARAIVGAQASCAQRLAVADDVIDNDANLDTLYARIEQLHRQYLALAVHYEEE
ncbi:MAG: dephospho-CoA kinase [Gammaproteobacteria bacterium]